MIEHPDSEVCLDNWLSLKSVSGGDGGKGARTKYSGGNVVNTLCNKTGVAVLDALHSAGTGTPPKSWRKSLPGQPNICTMFPSVRVHTSTEIATAQMMEAKISLQEAEESMRLERVDVLRV